MKLLNCQLDETNQVKETMS